MNRVTDLFVTYRFIKLLVADYKKLPGYKLGIFDETGRRIIDPETKNPVPLDTPAKKNAYTVFHKLIFNIRRVMQKIPFMKSKLGSYATALYLLKDTFKESADIEQAFVDYLKEEYNPHHTLFESSTPSLLPQGTYKLKQDVMYKSASDYDYMVAETVVYNFNDQDPIDTVMGIDIFKVYSENTELVVSKTDIQLVSEEIANVTGTAVAGTGDDASTVIVRRKKKKKKIEL